MPRPPETFDPSRPVNSVEACAAYVGCARGVAYREARSGGAWPSVRVGRRLLVKTRPFLALFEAEFSDACSCAGEKETP